MKKLILCLLIALTALVGCTGGEEVAALPTNTLAPLVTLTPRFTATPMVTRTPFPTFTFTPSITPIPPTVTNTLTPSPVPPIIGIISSLNTVNVRRGPGGSFPAFVALTPGTGVQVLGANPEGTWLNVRLDDGQEGWVSASLVRIEATPTPFPSVTPSPDLTSIALGTTFPTALFGGAAITPTLPRSIATTAAATATLQPQATSTLPPTATTNANLPIIDITAINLTATALASGRDTPTPTIAITQVNNPVVTSQPAQPTITAAPGTSTVQMGIDVLAYCDNPLFGVRPPTNLAAGSTIDIFWNWYAKTQEQIQQHRDAVVYEVRLNGRLLQNWQNYAQPVRLEGDGNYHIYWFVPSDPLTPGENRITYRVSWTRAITDGYENFGPGTANVSQEGSCTFTVR